jgi:hypothetical protein
MPPFPAGSHPFLFEGIVEQTVRLAATARAQLGRRWDVDANAGLHLVRNRGHVDGTSATRFVGGLTVLYRIGTERALP